jgi:hypothetical protein
VMPVLPASSTASRILVLTMVTLHKQAAPGW